MKNRNCMNGFLIIGILLLFMAFILVVDYCKKNKSKSMHRAGYQAKPNLAIKGLDTQNELFYDPDGSQINLENMNNILNLDIETSDEKYQAAQNPMNTLDVSFINPEIGGFQPVGYNDSSYMSVNPRSTFCSVFKQEWANKTPQVQDVEYENMRKTSDAFNCDWNDFSKLYCSQKPPLVGVRDYGCNPTNYPGACKSLIQAYQVLSPQEKRAQFDTFKKNALLLGCVPKAIDKIFCRSVDVKDGVINYGCNPDWYL